ncbi:unnamed protein product [Miscanthus lutarioriparius]|uniref:Endonuclease/exonuclease/phosphatase domain-containing protein n=1 Tax=Miscanthus lutarioriparius TaxID=422564 RepID=A0A811PH34_9POAL|nr:unnamed protein product [Miscanthus lutarioriparius]
MELDDDVMVEYLEINSDPFSQEDDETCQLPEEWVFDLAEERKRNIRTNLSDTVMERDPDLTSNIEEAQSNQDIGLDFLDGNPYYVETMVELECSRTATKANGSAGGILMGADTDLFNMAIGEMLNYSVSVIMTCKKTRFSWKLIVVYGPAYDEQRQTFLDELDLVMNSWQGPILIGGDFNLVRFLSDKNNGIINHRWADSFNEWKDSFKDMVKKSWNTPCRLANSMDRWPFKIRTLRRMVRGWAANEVAAMNKTKVVLVDKYSKLEILSESTELNSEELNEFRAVEKELEHI